MNDLLKETGNADKICTNSMIDIQTKFIAEIKQKIRQSQYEAMKAVNVQLINLYWEIGKSIVSALSRELQAEFPGTTGFSAGNLWLMAQFYTESHAIGNLVPLVREISWSKHVSILKKCKDNLEREFYIRSTRKFGWTKNVLIHQIENKSYEKYLLNQTNFTDTLPEEIKNQAVLAVKDEYNFSLLGLADEHSENELETTLVNNIRRFLLELGGFFTFVGNQFRIEVADKEYFIDLLLYHRQLQCLVAVELKIGEF
ncbi:MAG: PDDEXK nuclease domain-containing protein, partial [Bacteroidales bacterium]|nr:PDDEXK nuclease domain-containing protein [Bacteroidales bacterium]